MNLEIQDRYVGGTFVATTEGYKLSGDYQANGGTGKLQTINVRCNAVDGQSETYVGQANGHQAGDSLNFNLNGIVSEHLAGVASAVSELVTELTNENAPEEQAS